jgi:hypothetical protein
MKKKKQKTRMNKKKTYLQLSHNIVTSREQRFFLGGQQRQFLLQIGLRGKELSSLSPRESEKRQKPYLNGKLNKE